MTDKDVGELWAKAKLPVVRDLIRKLVDERGELSYRRHRRQGGKWAYSALLDKAHWHMMALKDFGINPEEFDPQENIQDDPQSSGVKDWNTARRSFLPPKQ